MFGIAGVSTPNNMINFHGFIYGDLCVCPTPIASISAAGATPHTCAISVCPNTFTPATACSWLHPAAPSAPSLAGTAQNVTVDANAGAARCGTVTYTPSHCGSVQTITFCQLAGVTWKCIYMGTTTSVGCGTALDACQYGTLTSTPALVAGDSYCLCYNFNGSCGQASGSVFLCITCAGGSKLSCCISTVCGLGSGSFTVNQGNAVVFCVIAHKLKSTGTRSAAFIGISCITSISGSECYGGGCCSVCVYTS
jgi:hypothetical protein